MATQTASMRVDNFTLEKKEMTQTVIAHPTQKEEEEEEV